MERPITPTTTMRTRDDDDVAKIVARVASKVQEWQALPLHDKMELLKQVLKNTIRFEQEWNAVAFEARGVNNNKNDTISDIQQDDGQGCARADVMTVGPATLGAYLNGLIASLEHSLQNQGMPPPPLATRTIVEDDDDDDDDDDHNNNNRTTTCIVTVWPRTLLDKLEAVGLKGELVVVNDSTSTNNMSLQISFEQSIVIKGGKGGTGGGGVAGILGAGNVNAPIEVLCEMFLHGRVVVYKPNPVNQEQAVAVVLHKILEPLLSAGFLEIIVGDANIGAGLVSDSRLSQVVLTGSAATLEKIKPLITNTRNAKTSICAELGGVNPWIVVPGYSSKLVDDDAWNARSIDIHARHLAFCKMTNNGHTCAAPQVVMVARDWPHRQEFINRVRYWLGQYAGNAPFYPGSDKIHARFAAFQNAEIIIHATGNSNKMKAVFEKQQHPILITNVDIHDASQKDVFELEAFCPVLAEVPIECNTCSKDNNDYSLAFLKAAIQVAEDKCFGSLTANIIIPDQVVKNSITGGEQEFDKILAKMSFGIVGVNVWPALAHSMPMLTWGAPPGHEQSGIGFIGNAGLYRNVQKTILRAPFSNWLGIRAVSVMSPRKAERVFTRFATYKLKPSWISQGMLFAAIFLGT